MSETLPEALPAMEWRHSMYTADQMQAYARAALGQQIAVYTAGVRTAALEEAAQLLDAEHEARKQHDNHAACYARKIRALATRA